MLSHLPISLRKKLRLLAGRPEPDPPGALRAEYVLQKMLQEALAAGATGRFLDIGCGTGAHTEHVRAAGVFGHISCIDSALKHTAAGHIDGSYETCTFAEPLDAIWASHVLEHVPNVRAFLQKVHGDLREGGVLAINVPPLKQAITVGHVSLWTPGLLLLNLVKAGFDCSQAALCRDGYNIGAVLRKRTCPPITNFKPAAPGSARPYLPAGLVWSQNPRTKVWYFDGDFERINWPQTPA